MKELKKMNLKQIIKMRGMTQVYIAKELGTIPPMVTKWINGNRGIVGKYLEPLAQMLDVSAAYLAGYPVNLPVYDWKTKQTAVVPVVAENAIPDYGTLYLVEYPDTRLLAVIISEGLQLTTTEQGHQPMTVDEIKDYHWVDNRGNPTVMLDDGLPCTLFNFEHGKIAENNDK